MSEQQGSELVMEPSRKRWKSGMDDFVDAAFQHYQKYSSSDDDNVSELVKLVEMAEPHVHPNTKSVQQITTKQDLLPVLISVASLVLAEESVNGFFVDGNIDKVEKHTEKCLTYFSKNAAAWVMGANFARMTARLSAHQLVAWYENAADCAVEVREAGLALLGDASIDDDVKEWIELLLLNKIVQSERLDLPGETQSISERGSFGDDDEMEWAESCVEATARLMTAMLPSIAGDHATALVSLKRFALTHRLHPNMWENKTETTSVGAHEHNTSEPSTYCREGGLLPSILYHQLCKIFAPSAPYWKESDHANRGYYSFFTEMPKQNERPKNLMDDVVLSYLLPLAKQHLDEETANKICGYEWRVKTQAKDDDLGSNLRFEYENALKGLTTEDRYPILSSVLYLTGQNTAGSTIMLDETRGSIARARHGWSSPSIDNSYLVFKGDLLRGTLPSNPSMTSTNGLMTQTTLTKQQLLNVADLWKAPSNDATEPLPNNLALMIGFWTHNVPKHLEKRPEVYTSCGPLPPDSVSWVRALKHGYESEARNMGSPPLRRPVADQPVVTRTRLQRVEPAWEEVDSTCLSDLESDISSASGYLKVPKGFSNRFFLQTKENETAGKGDSN